jgi:predicted Rossmann fold nucleotide-binding protein DprA/Smf involved in DNA uptake
MANTTSTYNNSRTATTATTNTNTQQPRTPRAPRASRIEEFNVTSKVKSKWGEIGINGEAFKYQGNLELLATPRMTIVASAGSENKEQPRKRITAASKALANYTQLLLGFRGVDALILNEIMDLGGAAILVLHSDPELSSDGIACVSKIQEYIESGQVLILVPEGAPAAYEIKWAQYRNDIAAYLTQAAVVLNAEGDYDDKKKVWNSGAADLVEQILATGKPTFFPKYNKDKYPKAHGMLIAEHLDQVTIVSTATPEETFGPIAQLLDHTGNKETEEEAHARQQAEDAAEAEAEAEYRRILQTDADAADAALAKALTEKQEAEKAAEAPAAEKPKKGGRKPKGAETEVNETLL